MINFGPIHELVTVITIPVALFVLLVMCLLGDFVAGFITAAVVAFGPPLMAYYFVDRQ